MKAHYQRLEQMYLSAPVQKLYPGIGIQVTTKRAEIYLPVRSDYFHAGGSLHGSVYFRLLDDAAYFAVNSMITETFMVTTGFHTELFRPVNKGNLTAIGQVIYASKNLYIAEAELWDDRNRKVAIGKGNFMPSTIKLNEVSGYEFKTT